MVTQTAQESSLDQSTIRWLLTVAEDPAGWLAGKYAVSSHLRKLTGGVSMASPGGVTT